MGESILPSNGTRLLREIDWKMGAPTRVSVDVIQLLIAASLVESRGDTYGEYLSRVFAEDPEFAPIISRWSREETEHGIALGTWLQRSVTGFNFDELFTRYSNKIPLSYQDSSEHSSIRGSKALELLSRCVVESGTSTYYKAIRDNVIDEPLRIICSRLAQDEINHFNIFKKKLDALRQQESIGPLALFRLSISRFFEIEDDQMTFAYFLARTKHGEYDRAYYSSLMTRALFSLYSSDRLKDLIKLNLRAFGLRQSKFHKAIRSDRAVLVFAKLLHMYMRWRISWLNYKIDWRRIRMALSPLSTSVGTRNG